MDQRVIAVFDVDAPAYDITRAVFPYGSRDIFEPLRDDAVTEPGRLPSHAAISRQILGEYDALCIGADALRSHRG